MIPSDKERVDMCVYICEFADCRHEFIMRCGIPKFVCPKCEREQIQDYTEINDLLVANGHKPYPLLSE